MSRWSLGLAALLAITACAPAIPVPRLAVSAETAELTLRIDLPKRGLLYVEGTDRVAITIDGPDLKEPYQKLTRLGGEGATLVSLTLVPVGPHRIVSLQSLDADNQPVPGALVRAAGPITAGANAFAVSPATTAVGEVATRLMALDKAGSTQVLSKLAWDTVATALAGYMREARLAHFSLLDAQAIAQAVHTSGGTFPAAATGLVRMPGKVELRPSHVPPGATYLVAVADPASRPVVLSDGLPLVIDNVAPGTWSLSLTPTTAGLPTRTQTVQVVAGGTLRVPIDLALSQDATALTAPLGPAASGVLKIGTTDTLILASGTTYADATGLVGVSDLTLLPTGGPQTAGPVLPEAMVQMASAVHAGKLYGFAGRDATTSVGTGFVWDPASAASPAPTAAMPNGLAVRGASAGTVGDRIFLTGGLKADESSLNGATLAYDPVTDTWDTANRPALNPARMDMASAVVGTTWYLFGGGRPVNVFVGGAIAPLLVAQPTVSAYVTGAATPYWENKAVMPTPRSGAVAVVVAGKIWVIGGAGLMGQPTAAVEVYDPATNAWEIRPPLKRARAFAAAGLLNGKIVVAGGLDGANPLASMPLASVEVLTP